MDKIFNSEQALKFVGQKLCEFKEQVAASSNSAVNLLREQSKQLDANYVTEINDFIEGINAFMQKMKVFVKENTLAITERQNAMSDYSSKNYKKTNIV